MYDDILVPTDGSDAALTAGTHAIDLASEVGARLHVVYVIDESAATLLFSSKSLGDMLKAFTEEGERAVSAIEEQAREAGVEVTTEIIRGIHIHEAILAAARRTESDLIVMGTAGAHGLEQVLGSTTQRVLSHATIPVLGIPTAETSDKSS